MNAIFRAVANRLSPGDRILILTYMGTPFERALRPSHRWLARAFRIYLRFRPGILGDE